MFRIVEVADMRGSCLCGDVVFEVRTEISKIYRCHCTLCRKQGGTGSNAAFVVESRDFRWVAGQDGISSFQKPTGFRSNFCARCGSPVPNPVRNTGYYWVPAGLLDEDVDLDVVAHVFVGSKAKWDRIDDAAPQYETAPELSAFFRLLHSGD